MAQPLEATGRGLAPAGLPRSISEQDGARPLRSRPGPGDTSWAKQQRACRRDPRDAGGISTRGDCAIACGSAQLPGCLGAGSGSSVQPPARATSAIQPRIPLLIPTLQPPSCGEGPQKPFLCPFSSSSQGARGARGAQKGVCSWRCGGNVPTPRGSQGSPWPLAHSLRGWRRDWKGKSLKKWLVRRIGDL